MSSRDKKIQLAMEAVNTKIMDEKTKLEAKIDHTETYLFFQIDAVSERLDVLKNRIDQISLKLDKLIEDHTNFI